MGRITIFAESTATGEALAEALTENLEQECRGSTVGIPADMRSLNETDVLLVSRGLPQRDLLHLLGLVWRSNHAPRAIFYEGSDESRESGNPASSGIDRPVLEVDPASFSELLRRIEETERGEVESARVSVRFRSRIFARSIAASETTARESRSSALVG